MMNLIPNLILLLLGSRCCHSSALSKRLATDDDKRRAGLVEMIPQQSCYYQGYNRRLTCNCNSTDTAAFVDLKMKYYVKDSGNEIGSVVLQQCRELLVNLDLHMVDATKVPVHFHAIRKVRVEKIQFEPSYSDTQELQLEFNNVEQLVFEDVFVEDTLKLKASNVKEAHFIRSTFAHIPRRGFEISKAKMLNIRDSKFLRVAPQAIVVEKTKEVTVVNNEMALNALEVVFAKDGSHLMISCNRLFGQAASPECTRTTTTTSTTTPEPPFAPGKKGNLREDDAGEGEAGADAAGISPELAAGAAAGFVVVTALVLLFVCLLRKRRRRRKEKKPEQSGGVGGEESLAALPLTVTQLDSKKDDAQTEVEPKESDTLLIPQEGDIDDYDDESKPKFSSPIWLEEIQRNKIFNRQKSLLSEEGLKDLAEGGGKKTKASSEEARPKKAPAPPPPTKEKQVEEETKENSRTESDEEAHKQLQESPRPEGMLDNSSLEEVAAVTEPPTVNEEMQPPTDKKADGDEYL